LSQSIDIPLNIVNKKYFFYGFARLTTQDYKIRTFFGLRLNANVFLYLPHWSQAWKLFIKTQSWKSIF